MREEKDVNMIYNYHCVDCGNLLEGEKISFDLGQMLGIDASNYSLPANALLISSEQMLSLIKASQEANAPIRNMERIRVNVSLRRFLSILVTNMTRLQNPDAYVDEDLTDWVKNNMQENLEDGVFYTKQNAAVGTQMVTNFIMAIEARFTLTERAEQYISEHAGDEQFADFLNAIQNSLANYQAIVYVEPEFFKDEKGSITDKLYTVRYTTNKNAAVAKPMSAPFEVRGFCPKCGKPVISGAGKYQHILIGLLGVQSAGKTSLITSLERTLQRNGARYGVDRFPALQLLCDSRYEDMRKNFVLYDNGYAVNKTDVTNAATFNASLQVWPRNDSNDSKRRLITFADIAGEDCYDVRNRMVNTEAFQVYPLIKSCDIYLLCTSINQGAYGNAEGRDDQIPAAAPMAIASQIYASIEQEHGGRGFMPPLAVVFTKADLAGGQTCQMADYTPLSDLRVNHEYRLNGLLQDISMRYQSTNERDVREPIEMACELCSSMENRTYTAMMYCSALGRSAQPYPVPDASDEEIRKNRMGRFVPVKLDDVWKWLLDVIGVAPYRRTGIPSWHSNLRGVSSVATASKAVAEHKAMFMNMSQADRKLYGICTADIGSLPLKKKLFESDEVYRERNLQAYIDGDL